MIFETHAHYDDDRFNEDRDELLRRLPEEGVGVVINSGASVKSTRDTIRLAGMYDHVYAAVGVHPSEIAELDDVFLDWMKEQTAWDYFQLYPMAGNPFCRHRHPLQCHCPRFPGLCPEPSAAVS